MKKAIFHSCNPLQVILASTLEYHGISRYHGITDGITVVSFSMFLKDGKSKIYFLIWILAGQNNASHLSARPSSISNFPTSDAAVAVATMTTAARPRWAHPRCRPSSSPARAPWTRIPIRRSSSQSTRQRTFRAWRRTYRPPCACGCCLGVAAHRTKNVTTNILGMASHMRLGRHSLFPRGYTGAS